LAPGIGIYKSWLFFFQLYKFANDIQRADAAKYLLYGVWGNQNIWAAIYSIESKGAKSGSRIVDMIYILEK
jgi:hypothetical protein